MASQVMQKHNMHKKQIEIQLTDSEKTISLELVGENQAEIFKPEDASDNGEAEYQIREGYFYEFKISDGYKLEASQPGIITQSNLSKNNGRISPNIYVGTLPLNISKDDEILGVFELEVQSVKTTYREDYRKMLGDIADKCIDLLMLNSSPVTQKFTPEFPEDPKTLYQRFAFLKSILESDEFNEAVQKIISSPVTRWKESETIKDIRSIRRLKNAEVRQICSSQNRIELPKSHHLRTINKLYSIPAGIKVNHKTETADTPENRFIKYALTAFQNFFSDVRSKVAAINNTEKQSFARLEKEALLLEEKLENYLSHSLFREVSELTMLPLNSPVLQRKDGYREVLRTWLMFDLAANLIWKGGDDIYSANKRDVSVLYEYWVYFKLLDIIGEVFGTDFTASEKLIEETDDGLGVKLKRNEEFLLEGIYKGAERELTIQLGYNKSFPGEKSYPDQGSWSQRMNPDYTLSIWPAEIDQKIAEREEIIVHIHFDAKYKVKDIYDIIGKEDELDDEKDENRKGIYKRADLLKMHAYKDAIRRSAGAYVLYPGDSNYRRSGFHELIPGLGAFKLKPSQTEDGSKELKEFLKEVLNHFLNRASQREKYTFDTYKTFKNKPGDEVREKLPEAYRANRDLIPDDTYILIGYYRTPEQLKWIQDNNMYNVRTYDSHGSVKLSSKEAGAKYVLIYGENEDESSKFFKLKSEGPKIFSKADINEKNYPHAEHDYYLVFNFAEETELEFKNMKWNINSLLEKYGTDSKGFPFSVSLTQLMNNLIKEDAN